MLSIIRSHFDGLFCDLIFSLFANSVARKPMGEGDCKIRTMQLANYLPLSNLVENTNAGRVFVP